MNTLLKLKELGFKRCPFYKTKWDFRNGESLVLDIYEDVLKNDGMSKKNIYEQRKKIHPKSNFYFKLKYNEYIIYADVRNYNLFCIYITKFNNETENCIIHTIDQKELKNCDSKKSIINLFPKEIKRTFLINMILE